MLVETYIQIYERLCAATLRGDDVDHYIDQLNGLWSKLSQDERDEVEGRKALKLKSLAA